MDTHIWRIARQRYGVALGGRSLTPRAHQEIGEGRVGPRCGTPGDGVPQHRRSPSLRRRLLPRAVGPPCRLGAGSEYPRHPRARLAPPHPSRPHPIASPHARSSSALTSAGAGGRLAAGNGPGRAEAGTAAGTGSPRDPPGGAELPGQRLRGDPCACSQPGMGRGAGSCLSPARCGLGGAAALGSGAAGGQGWVQPPPPPPRAEPSRAALASCLYYKQ